MGRLTRPDQTRPEQIRAEQSRVEHGQSRTRTIWRNTIQYNLVSALHEVSHGHSNDNDNIPS